MWLWGSGYFSPYYIYNKVLQKFNFFVDIWFHQQKKFVIIYLYRVPELEVEEENQVQEMTLDEWKNLQEQTRPKPEFNIRKPESTVPSKAVVIHKSRYRDDVSLLSWGICTVALIRHKIDLSRWMWKQNLVCGSVHVEARGLVPI